MNDSSKQVLLFCESLGCVQALCVGDQCARGNRGRSVKGVLRTMSM